MFSRSSSALKNTLRRHVTAVAGPMLPYPSLQSPSLLLVVSGRSFCAASAPQSNKKKTTKVKTKSGNVRGSRGHGWLHHYRNGGGGRHLQGDYADGRRPPLEELQAWNEQVLQLGKVTCYFDVTVGANQTSNTTTSTATPSEKQAEENEDSPPTESAESEVQQHRLYMDLATTAMPMTTRNFLELCQQSSLGYSDTLFTRLDKRVGLMGGDVVTNTGRVGRCATSWFESSSAESNNHSMTTLSGTFLLNKDRHIMTHIGGTISMLCPKVKTVDSRFMIVTQPDAPHLDGYHLAFGQLHPESLAVVQSWVKSIFTKQGHPLTELRILHCGVVTDNEEQEKAA